MNEKIQPNISLWWMREIVHCMQITTYATSLYLVMETYLLFRIWDAFGISIENNNLNNPSNLFHQTNWNKVKLPKRSKPSGLWTNLSFTILWLFLSFTMFFIMSFTMLSCDLLSLIIPWLWPFDIYNSLKNCQKFPKTVQN